MANQNGAKYGFTGLFPVARGQSTELRTLLRSLDDTQTYPRGSPFSHVPVIHMARLFVIDRLAYQGTPAKIDTLQSDYLLFACDFDGDSIDVLIRAMVSKIPDQLAAIWGRCVRYPGIQKSDQLSEYFERCQLKTTLFLADQPLASVDDILRGLVCRRRFGEFIRQVQRKRRDPAVLKRGFKLMWRCLQRDKPLAGDL
jgi:hypothetical protein